MGPMGPLRGPLLAHTTDDLPSFSLLPTRDARRVVRWFGKYELPLYPPSCPRCSTPKVWRILPPGNHIHPHINRFPTMRYRGRLVRAPD